MFETITIKGANKKSSSGQDSFFCQAFTSPSWRTFRMVAWNVSKIVSGDLFEHRKLSKFSSWIWKEAGRLRPMRGTLRVSMEVSKLVSWFITNLWYLQPAYVGVIIHLLSTTDIPVSIIFLSKTSWTHQTSSRSNPSLSWFDMWACFWG